MDSRAFLSVERLYQLKRQTFPNNECRLTIVKSAGLKDFFSNETHESRPETGPSSFEAIAANPLTLDISVEFEESSQPKQRKPSKFGRFAKNALLRSGGALDKHDRDPSHNLFITGTLPGSTPDAMAAIAQHSDWIIHRLKAWMSYYQESRYEFYVWELQKRGALHLHFCTHVPSAETREKIRQGFKAEWIKLLSTVGERAGCDMWKRGFGDKRSHNKEVVQVRVEEVKKSVAAYLGKYMSKGVLNNNDCASKYAPKRWWGRSRPLKVLTDKLTVTKEVVFATIQQGITYIRRFTDDMEPATVRRYEYQHKVGAGRTSILYFNEASWKEMELNQLMSFGKTLTPLQTEIISASRLMLSIDEVMEVFWVLCRSCRSFNKQSVFSLMKQASYRRLKLSESEFAELRALILDILALSSALTSGMAVKKLDHEVVVRHDRNIKMLWRLNNLGFLRKQGDWNEFNYMERVCQIALNEAHLGVVSVKPPDQWVPTSVEQRAEQLSVPGLFEEF